MKNGTPNFETFVDYSVDEGSVVQSDDPRALRQISRKSVAAVIWRRNVLAEFTKWIDEIPAANLPQLNTLVTVHAVEKCVQVACDISNIPTGLMRDTLASDIAALSFIISSLTGANLLNLRLVTATNDGSLQSELDGLQVCILCVYRAGSIQISSAGYKNPPIAVAKGSAMLLSGHPWSGCEESISSNQSLSIKRTAAVAFFVVINPAAPPKTIH